MDIGQSPFAAWKTCYSPVLDIWTSYILSHGQLSGVLSTSSWNRTSDHTKNIHFEHFFNCKNLSKLNDIYQHKVNLYFHCPNTWLHCSFLFITISVSGCHRSKCWNWFTLKREETHCIFPKQGDIEGLYKYLTLAKQNSFVDFFAQTLSIPEVFFLTQLISALQRLQTEMSLWMANDVIYIPGVFEM